ncbi:alpha/beta hydrolase family protein [Nocardia africana]|uniref:Acetoin dehydrogenase E2 subunit dihydrolipoyllysine-residue acetyltransferase n=1 Tax=Nocardia africana TaxID=134964 RepID=A0A378WV60_9NOCA|nr:alpha/beta fold hydrolase [Nocardia africana]MCC3313883.1 alpha/beta fold hydrolase [Nocardia africana]SUA44732.1 acetoin dehydrogenase E2 subunit dihydrolipoyllysine-residue acetyltransferase [Nocardia africana]
MTTSASDSALVDTTDGVRFTVRFLPADTATAPVMLILPAMGMKAKHYIALAEALRAQGVSAATVDLRAHGEALPKLGEHKDFGYREMIETDLPAVVGAVERRFPGAPVHLFGHSLGGQLAVLFAAAEPDRVASVTIIGTGTVFWWAFGPRRWWEALSRIQWIGLVSRVKGHWPGGVLIPAPMPGGVMIDWSVHSLTSYYRPRGSTRKYNTLLAQMTLPVLVISLSEDVLGPKSNVDFLASRMRSAHVTRWHIDDHSSITHRDHFLWIKDAPAVAAGVAEWIVTGTQPA